MPDTRIPANGDEDAAKPRDSDNRDLRPAGDGQAPRPAHEPAGSEGSSNTDKTLTDPATGRED